MVLPSAGAIHPCGCAKSMGIELSAKALKGKIEHEIIIRVANKATLKFFTTEIIRGFLQKLFPSLFISFSL